MKALLFIVTIALIIGLVFNLFIWMIAQGSGHNIPKATNISYAVRSVALLIASILFTIVLKRIKSKK